MPLTGALADVFLMELFRFRVQVALRHEIGNAKWNAAMFEPLPEHLHDTTVSLRYRISEHLTKLLYRVRVALRFETRPFLRLCCPYKPDQCFRPAAERRIVSLVAPCSKPARERYEPFLYVGFKSSFRIVQSHL